MGKINHKSNDKIRPEWTWNDLSIPRGRFLGVELRPEAIGDSHSAWGKWHGDATFGRIFAGMFKNQESEAVFSHIFKFLKKCYRQIGCIKV